MSLFKLFNEFAAKALPLIASGVGYTVITFGLFLTIANAGLKIAAFFLGICQ